MMSIRVVVPPAPLVVPADVPGPHPANDPRMIALIAAATAVLDGPHGELGRALGPQTLEVTLPAFGAPRCAIELPCQPIIEIVSIKYLDADGVEKTVAGGWFRPLITGVALTAGNGWPRAGRFADAVRIRYRAGYDGDKTGPLPGQVKQAIILGASQMGALPISEPVLRSETIEGIGSQTFTSPEQTNSIVRQVARGLVESLRVLRL